MGYHGILILVAMCCMDTLTKMYLAAQLTNRSCACSFSCDFSQVCSPTPNCTRENVALGKPANMSSFWADVEPSGLACLAVNGNTDTNYRNKDEPNPNCIHTGENDRNAYWLVDLGRNYTIKNITVYIRNGFSERMDLVNITVDDQSCYQFSTGTPATPLQKDIACNPPRTGSVVKFYKDGANLTEYLYLLNICEVQVWVCKPGLYGINCDNKCNCKDDEICDNLYGTCTRGCSGRFYGSNCTQECGNCNESTTCDFHTGKCLNGCKRGWQEPMCTVCRNGSYGSSCSNVCGSCKDSLPCNATNGACLNGCLDHFIGPLCKEICKNGTYGSNCTNKCGQCINGNNCNASNGVCLNGCEEGYELPLCNEICKSGTYGSNCTNKCGQCKNGNNCNASNGVCLNGCEEGYELPLCQEMCRNGSYGSDCKNTCGSCRNGRPCNPSNGVCLDGCMDGFVQPLCKENCNTGFYGTNCNISCGFCKDSQPCHRENGTCAGGYADGFKAPDCIEKCPSGTWGGECKYLCGACLEYACRHDNGTCEKGCILGHEGGKCEVLLQQDRDMTGPIVGSVLGAGLVISISVITAVLIWLRRTSMKEKQSPQPRSKVTSDASCEMHSVQDLNFHEDVYDEFEIQEDMARKERHDDNDMHPTVLQNNYEKLAPQYQNSSADSKPYEVLAVSSK